MVFMTLVEPTRRNLETRLKPLKRSEIKENGGENKQSQSISNQPF